MKRIGRSIRRVAVVYKDSTVDSRRGDEHLSALLAAGNEAVATLPIAHDEHTETLAFVLRELKRRGIEVIIIRRDELHLIPPDVDLIITIGGDGTFLASARLNPGIAQIGVKSAASSVGHFCLTNMSTFVAVLDDIISGRRKPYQLYRLELELNGEVLPVQVLNEVLVHDECPAGTSRYIIKVRGHEEVQKSTGIWIGTAAGSTAVMQRAGGTILPITQRQFQYVVREVNPLPGEQLHLRQGVMSADECVTVVSQMPDGWLFVDGKFGPRFRFRTGDVLKARLHSKPLVAFVDALSHRQYLPQG